MRNRFLVSDNYTDGTSTLTGWASSRKHWKERTTKLQRVIWWALLPIVYAWAFVFACAALIGLIVPPLGLLLALIAGYPGAIHLAWRINKSTKEISIGPLEGYFEDEIQ